MLEPIPKGVPAMPFDLAPSTCTTRCAVCPTAAACLIGGAERSEVERWNAAVEATLSLASAGKTLVEAGSPVQAIYTVRAGCLKSFTIDADGTERVRGFYLPGDIIGLDALGADSFPATVVAVTSAQVCRIPAAQVRELMAQSPALARRLLDRTSAELARALTLAGDYTAEQRLAAFLLSMRERLGAKESELKLPMTRRDIANHLRLATETVCRVLARLEDQGRIRSDHRVVRLVDARALRQIAFPAVPRAA
jgi:CRP/FNR family transcriptional regulator, anaerobic regulatory protein